VENCLLYVVSSVDVGFRDFGRRYFGYSAAYDEAASQKCALASEAKLTQEERDGA